MTLPSGPAKAAEASADEEAAETVPGGMNVGADAGDADERSGAASRSGKRGQLAAPAILERGGVGLLRARRDALPGRQRQGEKRERALPLSKKEKKKVLPLFDDEERKREKNRKNREACCLEASLGKKIN